ncbi:MAG: formylglycine-generating enzyme family protein [Blastocatellia bacterium]
MTLEVVEIPGGSFAIGSPNGEEGRFPMEGPQRRVTIPSFRIGKFEVTQAQWREVAKLPRIKTDLVADPSLPVFKDDEMPVNGVSWDDAVEFCARLSQLSGRAYRLPSEAEWEYAARAGTTTATAFGPTITAAIANCARQSPMFAGRLKIANAFGLYDMHGNVAEWCQDEWRENYQGMSSDGSWTNSGDARFRPVRGSNWGLADLRFCRSAMRFYSAPDARNYLYGLRVVTSALAK